MITLTNFTFYTPEYSELMVPGALYLQSNEGEDWYFHSLKFAETTLKVMYDKNGTIWGSSTDASALWPVNLSVSEVDISNVPSGFSAKGDWSFIDGEIVPRTYSSDELISVATFSRDAKIVSAREVMNEWQNDLMLGDISEEDRMALIQWNAYVKQLKALDLSDAPNIVWPTAPDISK